MCRISRYGRSAGWETGKMNGSYYDEYDYRKNANDGDKGAGTSEAGIEDQADGCGTARVGSDVGEIKDVTRKPSLFKKLFKEDNLKE